VVDTIGRVREALAKETAGSVPIHLRDTHYRGAKKLGHGAGYKYPHDYPNHYVEQQYLPDELKGRQFYYPSENGYEVRVRERLKKNRGVDEG
jgi:putative ATPase